MADNILKGTLNTDKTLPTGTGENNLSIFKRLLQTVTQRATQEATASGLKSVGVDPSKISGGTLSSVINLATKQKTAGISDIYTQTTEMLKNQKDDADKQLQTLISTGGIADLDDDILQKIAAVTEYPIEYLQSIKKAKQKSETKITESERQRAAVSEMSSILTADGVQGSDGFISPKDYLEKRQEWVAQTGYTPQEFDDAFAHLVNPNYRSILGKDEAGEDIINYNPYNLIKKQNE